MSKKVDSTYRSGLCRAWIKVGNPASIAVQREGEQDLDEVSGTDSGGVCPVPVR
jgi:hypothetical protein